MRLSLGARRARLVRQLLTESLLLAAVAGTLGVVMAKWGMGVLMAFVPPVIALGAFGSIGAMRSLLPGISPLDPITFIAVPVILGLIALLASWDPRQPSRTGRLVSCVALRIAASADLLGL